MVYVRVSSNFHWPYPKLYLFSVFLHYLGSLNLPFVLMGSFYTHVYSSVFFNFCKHYNSNPPVWFASFTSNRVILSLWKKRAGHFFFMLPMAISDLFQTLFIKKGKQNSKFLTWWFILKYKIENYSVSRLVDWSFFLKDFLQMIF